MRILDRTRLSATVGEARLKAAAGGGDPAELELGLLAGAEAVLVGAVLEASDKLTLQARLIAVSSGRVLASGQQSFAAPAPRRVAGTVESHSIEVAMRRLADGLASGFNRLPGNARYRRLAVLPFTELGEEAQKHRIGLIVSAEVATDLQRDHNLLLVERQKLTEVMGELRLQNSGAVDSARAAEIGKLSDAQALVIGTTSGVGDRYLVNARIVATESGETLAAESASISAAGMVALASDAVVLRSKKDAAFRSLLIPGWGQMYNRQPVKGGLLLGAEAGLLGASLAFHLLGNRAYDQYTSRTSSASLGPDPTGQAQQLYDTAASRYRVRNGLLIGAAAVWLFAVVDAWVSGVDGERLLGGGVALGAPEPGGARLAYAARF